MVEPTEGTMSSELTQLLTQQLVPPASGERSLVGTSASSLVQQMASARWPPTLGSVLKRARRHLGLSRARAARKLRRRLREKKVARATRGVLREWEESARPIAPWLLVEYLQAIEAPIEDWIGALLEFATASGESSYRRNVYEVFIHIEQASPQERRQLLPMLREWLELQATMVGLSWRMGLIEGAIAETLPAAALEPPAAALEPPAAALIGGAGLGERVGELSARLSVLLERAEARSSAVAAAVAEGLAAPQAAGEPGASER